jgi:hypothetical protein
VVRNILHELADRVRWVTLQQEPHICEPNSATRALHSRSYAVLHRGRPLARPSTNSAERTPYLFARGLDSARRHTGSVRDPAGTSGSGRQLLIPPEKPFTTPSYPTQRLQITGLIQDRAHLECSPRVREIACQGQSREAEPASWLPSRALEDPDPGSVNDTDTRCPFRRVKRGS